MSRGSIENLTAAQINIRSLGWLIPAFDTVTIPNKVHYNKVKAAEGELIAILTSSTIILRDAGSQSIAAGGVGTWIATEWEVGPPGQATGVGKPTYKTAAIFKGVVKKHFKHWFKCSDADSHLESGFQIMKSSHLKALSLTVNKKDPDQTYVIQIYRDPAGTQTLVHDDVVTLPTNARRVIDVTLNLALTADEYGLVIYRKTGTQDKSKFKKVRVEFQFEED